MHCALKRHLVFNMSRTGDDVEWFGGERKVTLDKKEMMEEGGSSMALLLAAFWHVGTANPFKRSPVSFCG